MDVKREVAILQERIDLQRRLVQTLRTDVENPHILERWISEKQTTIKKLQADIADYTRRLKDGPAILADACDELEHNVQELANLKASKYDHKLKQLAKAMEASGLSVEDVMAALNKEALNKET